MIKTLILQPVSDKDECVVTQKNYNANKMF